MQDYGNLFGGRFTRSTGSRCIVVHNPSDGKPICTVPDSDAGDVDAALSAGKHGLYEFTQTHVVNMQRQ